jgi:hypothetical protein
VTSNIVYLFQHTNLQSADHSPGVELRGGISQASKQDKDHHRTTITTTFIMFGLTESEEAHFHTKLCMGMLWISPVTFLFLYYVFPPNWGKNFQTLLGPTIPPRVGWCLMEIPNLLWSVLCVLHATTMPTANRVLLSLFVGHYINRSIVYPWTLNPNSKPLPLEIALAAFIYTNINGYIQAQALCQYQKYPEEYLSSPVFVVGIALFAMGVAINWQSDHILRNLRQTKPTQINNSNNSGYVIPLGGFFAYVSTPHCKVTLFIPLLCLDRNVCGEC